MDKLQEDEVLHEGEWVEVQHTRCSRHQYVPTQSDPNSNMLSYVCERCGSGASIDPAQSEVVGGVITEKINTKQEAL